MIYFSYKYGVLKVTATEINRKSEGLSASGYTESFIFYEDVHYGQRTFKSGWVVKGSQKKFMPIMEVL